MDERRLSYFLAIVEAGGVTAAATRLHVAQPSLSQALRSLERELGATLFDRVGRGLQLTSAGRALIGPARQALLAIDAARDAVREIADVLAGELSIAALATLAADPLAELVGRFRVAHPGVTVQIAEAESGADAGRLVAEGARELGLVHLPLARTGLVATPLGSQELLFVLPPGAAPDPRPLTRGRAAVDAADRDGARDLDARAARAGVRRRRRRTGDRRRDDGARGDRPARPRRRRRRAPAGGARARRRTPRGTRAGRTAAADEGDRPGQPAGPALGGGARVHRARRARGTKITNLLD